MTWTFLSVSTIGLKKRMNARKYKLLTNDIQPLIVHTVYKKGRRDSIEKKRIPPNKKLVSQELRCFLKN
jgi:hypothetical protein